MDIWRMIDKSPKGKTCIYQAYNKQKRGVKYGRTCCKNWKRGRFHLMDAETINDILGKKVLVER